MTLEKGLCYNFMVERIAEANNNHYYVIRVNEKECWVRMYSFEIYQNPSKNIISCEYRGTDSYGSPIFVEDKLSILHELYKTNEAYVFYYMKNGIDNTGKNCLILRDNYGFKHYLYGEIESTLKKKDTSILCQIKSFDKIQKCLILQPYSVLNDSLSSWIDPTTLFKIIEKEELINEYFYIFLEDTHSMMPALAKKNIKSSLQNHNNIWIKQYIHFLNKRLKYNLIQHNNLEKLSEFSQLMLNLLNWSASFLKQWKKAPKISKYEGLSKAILLIKDDKLSFFLNNYIESLQKMQEGSIKDGNIILSLMELDSQLFHSRALQYLQIGESFYNNKNINCKFLEAFSGILSQRINSRILDLQQDIDLKKANESSNILAILGMLILFLTKINGTNLQFYKTLLHRFIHANSILLQKGSTVHNSSSSSTRISIDNDILTWVKLKETCRCITPHESQKRYIEAVDSTDKYAVFTKPQQTNLSSTFTNDRTIAYWNLYEDGSYMISENYCNAENILKSVPLLESCKNGYLLLCYDKGNINKVPIRLLLEKKKKNFRYINGFYRHNQLKKICTIKTECFISIISLYNNEKYIKLYSTSNISKHTSLCLKGNQVVDSIVDETDYNLIPNDFEKEIPQRLIYSSPMPLGKNIDNAYYLEDIQKLNKIFSNNLI